MVKFFVTLMDKKYLFSDGSAMPQSLPDMVFYIHYSYEAEHGCMSHMQTPLLPDKASFPFNMYIN